MARVLCVLALVLLAGCASKPVQQKYAQQLAALPEGATVEQLKALFPSAYPAGQHGDLTVYEFADSRYSPLEEDASTITGVVTHRLHFYFRDGRLVQWGEPSDWRPDLDVRVRHE